MQKRGRPKGLANTVIGLSRMKAKVTAVAFEKLLPQQRKNNFIVVCWNGCCRSSNERESHNRRYC